MATDASTLDWGAVCNGKSAQDMWSPLEKQKYINELELLAVCSGLKSFLFLLKGKHVRIKSDNCTTVCYLNAMGATKSPPCNKLSKSVWMCCVQNDIWLTACHLPGVLNSEADKSSRQFQPSIFLKIIDIFRQKCQMCKFNVKHREYLGDHPSQKLMIKCLTSRSNWNLEMLVFDESGKQEYSEKNLSEQSREPTTNSTDI